jgi:hypothetical protein
MSARVGSAKKLLVCGMVCGRPSLPCAWGWRPPHTRHTHRPSRVDSRVLVSLLRGHTPAERRYTVCTDSNVQVLHEVLQVHTILSRDEEPTPKVRQGGSLVRCAHYLRRGVKAAATILRCYTDGDCPPSNSPPRPFSPRPPLHGRHSMLACPWPQSDSLSGSAT